MGNKRSNLENAAIAAGVAGATFAVGLGVRKVWRWFNREEPPALRQEAPPAPLPPAPSPLPPSPETDDGVIRPDFSGFRRSRPPTPSTPSSPSSPRPAPEPEPEPLVEPWMKEWAAKVAEGMGIKS